MTRVTPSTVFINGDQDSALNLSLHLAEEVDLRNNFKCTLRVWLADGHEALRAFDLSQQSSSLNIVTCLVNLQADAFILDSLFISRSINETTVDTSDVLLNVTKLPQVVHEDLLWLKSRSNPLTLPADIELEHALPDSVLDLSPIMSVELLEDQHASRSVQYWLDTSQIRLHKNLIILPDYFTMSNETRVVQIRALLWLADAYADARASQPLVHLKATSMYVT